LNTQEAVTSTVKKRSGGMLALGSEQRPIIVKVKTEEKGEKIASICDHFGWKFIMGLEYSEDLTDLKRALLERLSPDSVYDPCPCGSENKFGFCCGKKMENFDVNMYIHDFEG
jgi:hypothetical protein